MNEVAKTINTNIVNGVDANYIASLAGKIQEDANYGKFQFRASNQWIDGSQNTSSIRGFFAGGEENTGREKTLFVAADQPKFLGGADTAPNPVEHFLHALSSCLTTTLIYHAAVQGIAVDGVETRALGDMNTRGYFGLSADVRKGYERIRVSMRVKSRASQEALLACAMHSPVYEMAARAVPVEFTLVTS